MIVVVGSVAYRAADAGRPASVAGRAAAIARAAVAAGADVQLVAKIGADGTGDAVVVALGRDGIRHAALLRDPARPTPLVAVLPPRSSRLGRGEPRTGEADESGTAALLADADAPDADDPDAVESLLPGDPDERPVLEPADLELALRYLPGAGVVVTAESLDPALLAVVADGASWANARLVAIVDEPAPRDAAPAPRSPSSGPTRDEAAALREALGDTPTILVAPERDPGEGFARLVGAYAAALDAGREPSSAFRDALTVAGWEPAGPDTEPVDLDLAPDPMADPMADDADAPRRA